MMNTSVASCGEKRRLGHVPAWVLAVVLLVLLVALGAGFAAPASAGADTPVLAPLNPAFVQAMLYRSAAGGATLSLDGIVRQIGGHVPSPVKVAVPPKVAAATAAEASASSLPAVYDLRSLSRVTPVRDQGSYGTCWAFAAIGSLESALMPLESRDFSEDNLVNDTGYVGVSYNSGGNSSIALAYLARWGGPVDETADKYPTPGVVNLPSVKHVQAALMYPPRQNALDNDALKNAVMTEGGVDVSVYWDNAYYSSGTHAYYYNGTPAINHDVVIVGWDDAYSRTNFSAAGGTPAGDGAFIVRNSWSTGWGDGGYFYASYYDTTFARTEWSTAFVAPEATTNYSGVYQYDPLGWTNSLGYSGDTAWFANRFTAQATAKVSAVAFYAAEPGSSYQVYGGSSLSALTVLSSGTLADAGYQTIALATPLSVTANVAFYVAVRLTTPGYPYPVPLEYPISGWANAVASPGQSYVSSTGTSWTDVTTRNANTNVCLKAFTGTAAPSPAPTVTGLSPNSGPAAGGTQVTITGVNLTGATFVKFGTTAVGFTVSSDTQVIATAPAGAGTVNVTVTTPQGTSATGPANLYTYTQAPPPPTPTRFEQTDSRLRYVGSWITSSSSLYSGGSYKYTSTTASSVTIAFTGTSLDWIAKKGTAAGIAKVTLDASTSTTVDLYSSGTTYKQKVWSSGTLLSGPHTVKIEFTGTKRSTATSTAINIDAVDVVGTLTQAPLPPVLTRFEQTDSRLRYVGSWITSSSSLYSGGSYKYTSTTASSVTIAFTGTSLDWIAKKGTAAGIAKVTVDGDPLKITMVDLYNSVTAYKQKVWSSGTLLSGPHTVKIEFTGTKRSGATSTVINIDAVDVVGTLTQAP
jgi:C1A family cysteine protease